MAEALRARPTLYNGIQMRSRLEARYAAWLDEMHFAWEYEPRAYANQGGVYLPDFTLASYLLTGAGKVEPASMVVEVRPSALFDQDAMADRMAAIWDSEPDTIVLAALEQPWGDRWVTAMLKPSRTWIISSWLHSADPQTGQEQAVLGIQLRGPRPVGV